MQTENKRTFLHQILFPGLMGLVVTAVFIMYHLNVDPDVWNAVTFNGAAILLTIAEYIIPRNPSWNYFGKGGFQFREASIESGFYFLVDSLTGSLMFPIANFGAGILKSYFHISGSLPIPGVVQIIILVFSLDLIRHCIHRGQHRFGFLWRFHSLHHMAPRLSAVSTRRTHPIDDLMLYLPESILVLLLGFDTKVVAGFYAVVTVFSLVKHTNVDIPVNWLSRMFVIPRYHLTHHELQSGTDKTYNFSEIITFWDRVFGSFRGEPLALEHKVGVETESPRGLGRELLGWLYLPIEKL